MIRTWCKDHPIQFMACYLVFYLAFFKLLEQGIQPAVEHQIRHLDSLYTVLFVVVQ